MTRPLLETNTKTVVIVGFEGCLPSGLVGLVDMFWLANQANIASSPVSDGATETETASITGHAAAFKVITASLNGKALLDGMGRHIAVDAHVQDVMTADAVLIPGLIHGARGLPDAKAIAPVAQWLRDQHRHGSL